MLVCWVLLGIVSISGEGGSKLQQRSPAQQGAAALHSAPCPAVQPNSQKRAQGGHSPAQQKTSTRRATCTQSLSQAKVTAALKCLHGACLRVCLLVGICHYKFELALDTLAQKRSCASVGDRSARGDAINPGTVEGNNIHTPLIWKTVRGEA